MIRLKCLEIKSQACNGQGGASVSCWLLPISAQLLVRSRRADLAKAEDVQAQMESKHR